MRTSLRTLRTRLRRGALLFVGVGLGLAIRLALPTAHAGVESTGVGSTFGGGGGGGGLTTLTIGSTTITGGTTTRVLFDNAGTIGEDADLTFLTDTLTATKIVGSTSITDTGLTAGRVTFAGTAGLLSDDPDMTFATDTLTITKIAGTTLTGTNLATGDTTFGTAAAAANAVDLGETAGQITFEGATADAFETRLGVTDPTVGDQVVLIPNLAGATTDTIVTLATNQTISGQKLFNTEIVLNEARLTLGGGGTAGPAIRFGSVLTPDSGTLGTGGLANSWHIAEAADFFSGYDFQNGNCATAACTDPTLIIHSHNQSTTQYLALYHDGTSAVLSAYTGFLLNFTGGGGQALGVTDIGGGIAATVLPSTGRLGFSANGTAQGVSPDTYLSRVAAKRLLYTGDNFGVSGTAPAVTSCGISPTTVTGNDTHGRLTTGSGGTVQSCTLTFATAYTAAPSCTVSDETTILLVRATATTTTLVLDSAVAGTLASQVLTYICLGV